MPLKTVQYQKLETEESDLEEDELPPAHVKLQNASHVKSKRAMFTVRNFPGVTHCHFVLCWWNTLCNVPLSSLGDRWNHIDNLDEFFERVSVLYCTSKEFPKGIVFVSS